MGRGSYELRPPEHTSLVNLRSIHIFESADRSRYSAPGITDPVTLFFFKRSTTTGGTSDEMSPPN